MPLTSEVLNCNGRTVHLKPHVHGVHVCDVEREGKNLTRGRRDLRNDMGDFPIGILKEGLGAAE